MVVNFNDRLELGLKSAANLIVDSLSYKLGSLAPS